METTIDRRFVIAHIGTPHLPNSRPQKHIQDERLRFNIVPFTSAYNYPNTALHPSPLCNIAHFNLQLQVTSLLLTRAALRITSPCQPLPSKFRRTTWCASLRWRTGESAVPARGVVRRLGRVRRVGRVGWAGRFGGSGRFRRIG